MKYEVRLVHDSVVAGVHRKKGDLIAAGEPLEGVNVLDVDLALRRGDAQVVAPSAGEAGAAPSASAAASSDESAGASGGEDETGSRRRR